MPMVEHRPETATLTIKNVPVSVPVSLSLYLRISHGSLVNATDSVSLLAISGVVPAC
jgi:hypothetical protein